MMLLRNYYSTKLMIRFDNACLFQATKLLFDEADLNIYPGDKVGVVGRNGCGKSSLFRVFNGGLTTSTGSITWPNKWKIGIMEQEIVQRQSSALEYVLSGDNVRSHWLGKLAAAEHNNDTGTITKCYSELDSCDAWTAQSRAQRLLSGLGFAVTSHHNVVSSFSGGWQIRLNLAKVLMQPADCLLLDEPTNHLDIDAIEWLERWLKEYAGTLLLISHDRDFLDSISKKILWFERQKLQLYSGNYEQAQRQRIERLAQQHSMQQKQQIEIAHMQDFVRRFRAKASKAKQAQSRLKALGRLEVMAAVRAESPFTFRLHSSEKTSDPLLNLRQANLGYGETPILQNIDISIRSGDRIGVLGVNGAGKSTLLKTLAGELHILSGKAEIGEHLKIGYFAQHQVEALALDTSPVMQLQKLQPKATEQLIRNFLGSFNFREEATASSIHHFSGGEKARLALALIAWQKPNLLILDEPANHLDMDMRDALLMAMQSFAGAVLLVSHDRYLLRHSVDYFWLVANGDVTDFTGDLSDYQKIAFQHNQITAAATPAAATQRAATATHKNKKQQRQAAAQQRNHSAARRKQRGILEKQISQLEKKLAIYTEQLADSRLYAAAQKEQLHTVLNQQGATKKLINAHEAQWLKISEQLQ